MSQRVSRIFSARTFWLPTLVAGALALALLGTPAEANHPVLLEGNCDSPVPGTTVVGTGGICGDYDGDGRIGTAEDTDGADRIFGTLSAALGPGTGAAAGTGANQNGRIVIVKSGRFSEAVDPVTNTSINVQSSGHVQIEAAPGVDASIDAVFQGDPAGGNNVRQEAIGVRVFLDAGATATLRNLTIRNFAIGVRLQGAGRLVMENCRVENNRDFGVQVLNESRLTFNKSSASQNGRRVGTANNTTAFGHGIQFADLGAGFLTNSIIVNNLRAGVSNTSGRTTVTFHTLIADNDGGNVVGNALSQGTF